MTARLLQFLPLVVLLAACTANSAPAPTSTTSSTVPTTTARIDKPRNVTDLDACKLLVADDFRGVAVLAKPPIPPEQTSSGCTYLADDGSPNDLDVFVAVGDRTYEDVVFSQPKGAEEIVDGHSVWTSCTPADRELLCMSTAAVTSDKVLEVSVAQDKARPAHLQALAKAWLPKALARVPVT